MSEPSDSRILMRSLCVKKWSLTSIRACVQALYLKTVDGASVSTICSKEWYLRLSAFEWQDIKVGLLEKLMYAASNSNAVVNSTELSKYSKL